MKYIEIIILTLLSVLTTAVISFAGPSDTLWTRTYGGSGLEIARSCDQTGDGGYVMAGWTTSYGRGGEDCYIVKTDSEGDTLWTRAYGSIADERLYHIKTTSDGGCIAAGHRQVFRAPGSFDFDICMIKTDANGDTLWTRTYGGNRDEEGRCVLQTCDGGYVVCGQTKSFGAGQGDFWLLRTDSNGDTLWTKTYGGNLPDLAFSAIENTGGGYTLAGFTHNGNTGSRDGYVIKVDENGDTLWTRIFGTKNWDEIYTVIQTDDGGYLCCGGRQLTPGDSCLQATIIKIDSAGYYLWDRSFGQRHLNEYFMSACQTSDGGYILGGTSGIEDWSNRVTGNVYTVKTDNEGHIIWSRIYGVNRGEQTRGIQQVRDGSYIVAGKTYGFGPDSSCDFWLLKLAGELQEPEILVNVVPDDPPIIAPAGSSFTFSVDIYNHTDTVQTVDMWFMLTIPDGATYGPVLEYDSIQIDPRTQVNYQHIVQEIPLYAPRGQYIYHTYIGDYPNSILTASFFYFEVIRPRSDACRDPYGQLPNNAVLYTNYPNPFNATTCIDFHLMNESAVDLSVYNLLGRKVCTLIDGTLGSGAHTTYWNADNCGSGIYIYRLRTEDETISRKMELIK